MRFWTVIAILFCLCCLLDATSAQDFDVKVNLQENRKAGHQVYSFPPPASNQEYLFYQANDSDSRTAFRLFKISERGIITTTTPIDYEIGRNNFYDLIAIRRNRGDKEGGIPSSIRVTITDTNNYSPTFPLNLYDGRIKENSPADVVVQGLENCFAEDRDTGGVASYSISGGNDKGYFKAETRKVGNRQFLVLKTTNVKIVKDTASNISLTVRANDGLRFGITKVVVEIVDDNNNKPVFEEDSYSTRTNEDTPLLTSILRVRATDLDTGANGGIYYYISGSSPYFSVDAITGVIKVVRDLGNLGEQTKTFNVVARDRGAPSTSVSVQVSIKINEIAGYPPPDVANPGINTPPTFPENSYSANVREDFPVGAALLVIHAVDRDPPGRNRRLRYSLAGDNTFRIDTNSGVVILNNALNYEGSNKVYRLTVTATDDGAIPQRAAADLTVTVQDVDENRNVPKFQIGVEQQVSSVRENSRAGTQISPRSPRASDSDQGQDGQVAYSIASGSGLAYFKIDENSGDVTTATPLDREQQDQYDLIIQARDKALYPLYIHLYLMITVSDMDDNFPDFSQPIYYANVPEKAPADTFVTLIHATDRDGQVVQYSMNNGQNFFDIQSTTGLITTTRPLDPTRGEKSFLLSVAAASGNLQSEAQVIVTVVSKSDSPPSFKKSQYETTVPENLGPIDNLLCLAAVDVHGKAVEYSIPTANDGNFRVDKNSGRFSAADSFDYEVVAGGKYTVTVQASSGRAPRQTAFTTVLVDVEDERDPPKFANSKFKFVIGELTRAGSSIIVTNPGEGSAGLVIIDEDTDKSQFDCSLESIQSLDVLNYFKVKNVNGECILVTQSSFDHFDTPVFTFDVRATDKNYRNMFASASVEVVIQDTNNNPPKFSQDSYWASVSSSFPVTNSIMKITATDKDSGSYGEITYQLLNTQDRNRFSLDSNTGVLSSASSLAPKKYQLQVQASDLAQSESERKKSTVDVFVTVYSTGTTVIEFDPKSYTRTLPENSPQNTLVFTVSAKGPRSISYSIVGGNVDNAFKIEAGSGKVTTRGSLNREVLATYQLVVRAETSSPSQAVEVTTTINLSDQNDERPRITFIEDPKEIAIEDYSQTGAFVIKVIAVDGDIGNFGKVQYSVLTSGSPFQIDKDTGVITAGRQIRRTEKQQWDIQVQATDGGGLKSAVSKLKIHVTEGSEAPQIQDQFDITLDENKDVGSAVKDISNSRDKSYKYSILSGNTNQAFCIDNTGLISVAKALDREKVSSYTLKVSVSVGNKVKNTTVVVSLRDKNDDAPRFTKSLYTFEVSENEAGGKQIGTVSATDRDSGPNGDISYRLLYTVYANSKFAVDSRTGSISSSQKLDFESIKQHVLYLKAQDAGSPQLSTITKVVVNVKDENDEDPRFSGASYVAKVALDTKVDSQVLLVRATDLDSGDYGKVIYNITDGNDEGAFRIVQDAGVIKLRKSLTTVSADQFSLTVVAKDKGTPPRSGQTTVQLNVFLPDGPPKFVVKPVVEEVTEGVQANNRVLVVKAATSEALTYEIIGGNADGLFRIVASTGEILVTRELDYEESSQHQLRVRVMDTRDRSDQVDVVIKVKNINDNPPKFPGDASGFVERKVEDDFQVGDTATRLSAYDMDADDLVTYTLSSNAKPYFSIDNNGFLIAKKPRKDIQSPFKFEVTAKDSGSPPRETKVQVQLVFVSYRPDEQPVRVYVKEDKEAGSAIATVPRYFPGGTLSIIYPQGSNFTVDNSGKVRMTTALDFEDKQFYLLTVREKEPPPESRTNDVDVEINVVDINDNKPIMTRLDYFGRVNTNSRPGASAYQLKAEDKDGGLGGVIGYNLVSRGIPFAINPLKGLVETGGVLEDKGGYNVTLFAYDFGIPRQFGDAKGIDIKTVKLLPYFSEISYKFQVSEKALPGELVGVVNASSVSGAPLMFTIVQGDTENKFRMSSGEIRVNSLLDREKRPIYNLKVRATEQIPNGYIGEVEVEITVLNANEFFPEFDPSIYSKTIREDVSPGTSVLQLSASDCDCQGCNCMESGLLKFSLEGTTFFKVDEDTGIVSVGDKPLDYEMQRSHIFIAAVTDVGEKKTFTARVFVKIVLQNINDNAPIFQFSDYNIGIAEDAEANKALAAILARDADGSKVTYTIPSGNLNVFQVNSNTGVLSLKQGAQVQSQTQYTLRVRATDEGGLFNEVRVVVNIEDSNDNRPVFKTCSPNVKVKENLKSGERVTQVSAEDTKDRGRNKEIEYKLVTETESFFQIDNTTGVITTVTSLDRETRSSHTLIVQAEDGGHDRNEAERLLSYCIIDVQVEDRNDNYPLFVTRTYFGSVYDKAQIGTSVVTVAAADADIATNNKMDYAFSVPDNRFVIDGSSGEIRTNVDLSGKKGTVLLAVRATNEKSMEDINNPEIPRESETKVEIIIADEQPPRFTQPNYNVDVGENIDVGARVISIKAAGKSGNRITYSLVKSNPEAEQKFQVDPGTGLITTASTLDYEQRKAYKLQFRAKELETTLYATCFVSIALLDVNDDTPTFKLEEYTARVPENANPNFDVIQVKADDRDTGIFGQVTYSLDTSGISEYQFFNIDATTGTLTTKQSFDREDPKHAPKYNVIVRARDKGDDANAPLDAKVTVTVAIVDENDEKPVFAERRYTASVQEDAAVGTSIKELTATDKDVGENAKLDYFVSSGNSLQSFRMETVYGTRNYGVLVLDGKLDFETQKKFEIQVTATDRKNSDTVPVEITVLDTNDNKPEFTSLFYKKEIEEGLEFGKSVTQVSATDEDSSNVQDKLQYSIEDKGARFFAIDKDTGFIKTANKKLDREKEQVVSFFVYASDGKHIGRALVSVKLTDVNDNAPSFTQKPYVGYVEENKKNGTSVMVLQAVDLDAGSNAEIVYTMIDNAGGRFEIDSKTGLVTTSKTLKKDEAPNGYEITVSATDQGNPKLVGRVNVTILVTDGNDKAPKFNPSVYRANVSEDALPGHLVRQVTATDADEGLNAELEFTIIAGNDPYKFYIDPRTGRIHVSGLLDFDKGKKSFNLTVMVSDRGMPPKQADRPAFVYINLFDSNDNPPEFVPAEYKASVSEDLPVGETVQLVTAVDHDTGTNALFDFAITDGDDADLFSIKPHPDNRSIGVIYTLLNLDREVVPRYKLTVTATDTGGLQGDAMVIVDLVDVNDNGPWFIPPYYEGTIKAGVNEDQLVTTLRAYDPDESSNGLPFTFSIVNNTDRFKLQDPQDSDVSAKVYSVGTFDRAVAAEWILRVKGEDSGRPLKANFTYVYVDVVDDRNIHQPFDGSLVIIVNAYNSKFKGGVIGKAYYRDNDYGGDRNKYTMPSQEFFTINEDSGDIQADPNIPLGEYSFNVQVEEQKPRQGNNFPKTVTSRVSVVVRGISEAEVQNSVVVQILGLRKTSYLVGDYYNKLLQLLANILSSGDTDSVFIFSIQKAPARRLPVGVLFGVEIHLAVASISRMDVVKLLVNAKSQLENLGLAIGAIGIDECAYEFQKVGKCRNEATGSSAYTVVSGDYGPQEAPEQSLTVVSVDVELKAVYSSIVPGELNCTTGTICLHGGTCHNAVPKGIICECGREYRGPECQSTTRTFKGNSYIWLDKLAAYERSHVSLQFMTGTANGLLLFQGPLYEGANNGLPDFMALLLVNGYAQLVITLGAHPNAPLVLYMNRGDRLDNREWHTVEVIRSLKKVTLRIDKCSHSQIIEDNGRVIENREMCEIEGEIWGSAIYLNGFGPLQIGGVENVLQEPTINYKGFEGCIRNIYDNGIMYDLKTPLKDVNTEEGCRLPNNACPNCNNRGYCEPRWVYSICVCDLGFSGPDCDSTSNAKYYLPNSFSQYQVKQARRKRRELVPPPVSMSNEFFTNIALQVKVSPESSDVVILLASNSLGTEFNRIDVKNRVLRYVFRLGDRMKILSIPQLNITDNKYHAVIVKREGNRASLQVDYSGKVEGTTRGVHKLLNMGGGSYFAGGLPNITEVRIVEAFVNSGGNAILRTADGTIVASGMGQDSSSYFGSAQFVGSVITVGASGEVDVNRFNGAYQVKSRYRGYRTVTYRTKSETRIVTGSIYTQDGSANAAGGASGSYGVSRGSAEETSGDSAGTIIGNAHSSGSTTGRLHAYGAGVDWTLSGANGADQSNQVQVIGDFGGCTAANSYNGVDLDGDPSIEARRQNVVNGCPCDVDFCLHGGTCVNAVPPFCDCPPGWNGPRCETVDAAPKGKRLGSRWANPAVIACILVILLAVLFIVGAVLLKRRREPVVVAVVEDGHVHDNVRPYHDEGAGEEDNFGYDITQLMKYTYVENGGLVGTGDVGNGKFKKGPGAGEEEFTVAEDKPLLQGAMPGIGMQHGVTTITKRRVVHPESIDVKQFIDTRVHEADGEYVLSIDELHIYRYEGDDSDVDDLSELGDSDEEADEEEEQEFDFLQAWGRKFDNLNRIFNEED